MLKLIQDVNVTKSNEKIRFFVKSTLQRIRSSNKTSMVEKLLTSINNFNKRKKVLHILYTGKRIDKNVN